MPDFTMTVSGEAVKKRLDVFLLAYLTVQGAAVSRTTVQKFIADGLVTINGVMAVSAHYKMKAEDIVHLGFEPKTTAAVESEDIVFEVVYEDDDLAVINKPAGLVVHPAPGNAAHTLVNGLLHRFKTISTVNPLRPGIVHRLDKETSGLLVIAKNNESHLDLAKQFAAHSIKRTYLALVKGRVEYDEHVIDAPIGRHPYKRKDMAVGFGAHTKYARTMYRTLKREDDYSFLELKPYTGRTHQLRVHLAFIGHPILGDTKYGKQNPFIRLALHAQSLGFLHPRTHKYIEFSSRAPEEFTRFLQKKTQKKTLS